MASRPSRPTALASLRLPPQRRMRGGANSARFEAVCVIDISDTDDTDGTETYTLQVRGSAASNMGSLAVLAEIPVTRGTTGKIELPFCNVKQGTAYRYVDVYFRCRRRHAVDHLHGLSGPRQLVLRTATCRKL